MKTWIVFLLLLPAAAWSQDPKLKPGVVTKITISPQQMTRLSSDYNNLQQELNQLQEQRAKIETLLKELQSYNEKMKSYSIKLKTWEQSIDSAGGSTPSQLLQATKQMQETQMSFNLQYLQLQSQMQHENRSYTAISNIMKTKHDTAKNSVSNIR